MEMARDVVIVISGIVVTLVAIFVAALSYSLYRDLKGITKSVKVATAKAEALATFIMDEVAGPLQKLAGMVQGITHGICAVKKMWEREE